MILSLTIENTYEDGDEVVVEVVVLKDVDLPDPPIPHRDSMRASLSGDDAWNDWAYDNIYPLTGTGRTEGVDSWYDVTVTASSDHDLVPVGTKFEWGY